MPQLQMYNFFCMWLSHIYARNCVSDDVILAFSGESLQVPRRRICSGWGKSQGSLLRHTEAHSYFLLLHPCSLRHMRTPSRGSRGLPKEAECALPLEHLDKMLSASFTQQLTSCSHTCLFFFFLCHIIFETSPASSLYLLSLQTGSLLYFYNFTSPLGEQDTACHLGSHYNSQFNVSASRLKWNACVCV